MAGRPLTKFKKVNELNLSAFKMIADMYQARPKQFLFEPDATDANCAAWREAWDCLVRSAGALERLTERLAEKAGLERYSPLQDDDSGDRATGAINQSSEAVGAVCDTSDEQS